MTFKDHFQFQDLGFLVNEQTAREALCAGGQCDTQRYMVEVIYSTKMTKIVCPAFLCSQSAQSKQSLF